MENARSAERAEKKNVSISLGETFHRTVNEKSATEIAATEPGGCL
jgi:hypothetical protein